MRVFSVTHSIDAAELQSDERDEDGEELPADVVVEEEVREPLDLHSLQGGVFSQHLLHLWSRVHFSPPQPAQSWAVTNIVKRLDRIHTVKFKRT